MMSVADMSLIEIVALRLCHYIFNLSALDIMLYLCVQLSQMIIIIISKTMFMCCHYGRAIARVHPVHLMNVERRQVAADPRPSQTT